MIAMNFIDIILAVILDLVIGDPKWFPHPIIYIGKLISFLEKLARKYFKTSASLKISGGLIVIIVCSVSFIIPYQILKLTLAMQWAYHILNILIIWTTIAARCLSIEGKKAYYALKRNDIEDARVKISYIVGRDTSKLSEKEIIRADVETIAENTSDGVIAPLVFALILGAPFAMLYKGVNTMDSMLGYMNEKYRDIGFFPAKVDDIFNFIPARLTGLLICISAPTVHGNIFESFKIMLRDRKNHKSPNCGYPEAAAAGAMQIQIGGTNIYFGEKVVKPTIGDDICKLDLEKINESIKLMYASEIVLLLFYGCFYLINIMSR
jgi:adenosylcobinamide-phosphate synthase